MKTNTIKEIIEGVAMATGWSVDEIKSKSRVSELVLVRQICYYIAYKEECYTFTYIGRELGGRDHTTVMHGVKKVVDYYTTKDGLFNQYMEAIRYKSPHIYSTLMPIKQTLPTTTCNYSRLKIQKYA